MRKVIPVAALAAAFVVLAVIAATAGARTETRFSVVDIQTSQKALSHNTILTRGRIVNLAGQRVGRSVVKITFHQKARTARIRAIAFFRGEGSLKVKGRLAQGGDQRIPIIGGTGDFNGAAGKLKTHNLSKRRTLLTFIFVQ
jgi:hypothetical protein